MWNIAVLHVETIPMSEVWVWYEYSPLPSGDALAAVQHGHFTQQT